MLILKNINLGSATFFIESCSLEDSHKIILRRLQMFCMVFEKRVLRFIKMKSESFERKYFNLYVKSLWTFFRKSENMSEVVVIGLGE